MGLKLNGSTDGSVSLDAPADTSPSGTDVSLTLPTSAGSSGQYLQTDGSGTLSWQTVASDAITEGNTTVECVDTGSDGHITFDTEGSEQARIDSSGRLLVGTATAQGNNHLQLEGSASGASEWAGISLRRGVATASLTSGQYLGAIAFQSQGGAEGGAIRGVCDANWSASSHPTRLMFETAASGSTSATERMRIKSDGTFKMSSDGTYRNVSTASHELVQTNSGFAFQLSHETSTPAGIIVQYTGAAPNGNDNEFFFCQDTSVSRGEWRSNGGIANYQANDSNLCDEREKKNIVDLDSTWDCLKHWELKKFHYNEDADTDDKRYGVIAQQIAEHCPEVITDWKKQKAADAVLDEDGNEIEPAKEEILRLAVKEQQMYWMAIRALQEAQTRIEALETANASLEARLTALEGGAS